MNLVRITHTPTMLYIELFSTQQTRGIHPMLFQYWPTVFGAGPTLAKHWVNALCLLSSVACISLYIHVIKHIKKGQSDRTGVDSMAIEHESINSMLWHCFQLTNLCSLLFDLMYWNWCHNVEFFPNLFYISYTGTARSRFGGYRHKWNQKLYLYKVLDETKDLLYV